MYCVIPGRGGGGGGERGSVIPFKIDQLENV